MTKKELQGKIKSSGLKKGFLAKKINMSRVVFSRKLRGSLKFFSDTQIEIILSFIK